MGCHLMNTKLLTSNPQLSEDYADRSNARHLLHQWLRRDTKAEASLSGTTDYFRVALNQGPDLAKWTVFPRPQPGRPMT
jgi:hypothetical protein